MQRLKLTKTVVEKLPYADKGKQVDYWDTELKGFGCRVSATSKTYFVMRRIKGKLTRVSLGRHTILLPDKAREKAIKALGELADGIDINMEKAKAKDRGITLQRVHDEYLAARPEMKRHTITVDKSLLNCHLSDWLKKPIQEISRDMVAKRHLKIAKESGSNTANNAMRLFRRLYNFALALSNGNMEPNPVRRLSDTRQWFRTDRRQTVIKDHQLSQWYEAVLAINNPTTRDYLLLLLFTGLRKNEGLSLRWQDIDMEGKTLTIPETKNGKPHTLPMSNFLYELFQQRLSLRENDFVFPGGGGKTGNLVEPKRHVQSVIEATGIKFCLHDLRRTFASIAESVVSYSVLKRLMNHTDKDVTQGYIVLSTDKLRLPMQMVTDTITSLIEPKEAGKVIPLRPPVAGPS